MFKHVVLWDIQAGLDKEATIKKLKEVLLPLVDTVPTLKHIELGVNSNTLASGHDICLYTEFDSAEDHDAYQVHPAHKEAGAYVKTVVCNRADCDYLL